MSIAPLGPKNTAAADDLTDRQRQVIAAITAYQNERGFAPSFREIGEATGLKSTSSVKHQLHMLEEKGYIRLNANKGRAMEILTDPFARSHDAQDHGDIAGNAGTTRIIPSRGKRIGGPIAGRASGRAHRRRCTHHGRTACG